MRPFSDVLAEIRGGADFQEATDALSEVVAAVIDVRKDGSVTVKLDIKPNADGTVNVKASITKKVPEMDKRPTVFFADDAGALVREDPKQTRFDLRESNTERPVRDPAAGQTQPEAGNAAPREQEAEIVG